MPASLKDRSTMDNEILVQQLEATGDYKVIRRFIAPDHYASLDGVDLQQLRIAMIIDTETTGLSKETDKIIDLGFVLAEFNAKTGQVHRIVERYSGFEDPGMPIPASIIQPVLSTVR
jgi:DNA polymerase III subunit epsilon